MNWFAQAPSNIALIKYMGKTDPDKNVPANSSLSYTLDQLNSYVELTSFTNHQDRWEPLELPGALKSDLNPKAQQRFLQHLNWLKQQFAYSGHFIVRSCNNFPMATGLASSASSFAALTICAVRALTELTGEQEPEREQLALWSRHGSGSSVRSFYQPWALWTTDKIETVDLPYNDLLHQVIVVSHEEKAVSSREAHARVTSSPLYADRPKRAEQRLQDLLQVFRSQDWRSAYDIVWDEFQDLHKLFETSEQSFSYMNDDTQRILDYLKSYWLKHQDGPLITMDAGPNIHLLYRPEQTATADFLKKEFLGKYDVI